MWQGVVGAHCFCFVLKCMHDLSIICIFITGGTWTVAKVVCNSILYIWFPAWFPIVWELSPFIYAQQELHWEIMCANQYCDLLLIFSCLNVTVYVLQRIVYVRSRSTYLSVTSFVIGWLNDFIGRFWQWKHQSSQHLIYHTTTSQQTKVPQHNYIVSPLSSQRHCCLELFVTWIITVCYVMTK